MKKILFFISIGLLFVVVGCSTPTLQEKIEALVKKDFPSKLDDPNSFQLEYVTIIDSVFSSYDNCHEYYVLRDSLLGFLPELPVLPPSYSAPKEEWDEYEKSETNRIKERQLKQDTFDEEVKKLKGKHIPHFIGWRVSIYFRGNNKFGALVKDNGIYYINQQITSISDSEEQLARFYDF